MTKTLRTLTLAVAACIHVAVIHAVEPADRPNILWLVSEDNNPYLGCYGEPLARTPVLDQLARDGVRYTRAHSPAPVCAPTRSSLITGRWAPGLGTQHMRSDVPMPEGLRFYPAFLRDAGYFCVNNAKTDYNTATLPGTWDEDGNKAHWKNHAPGQPFFAAMNFGVTHESRLHTREALTTDPAKVRVPAYLPDTPDTRADIAQYHDRMAQLDTQIAAALAELAAAGLVDDTIVFYFADNGGVLPRSKRFLYDNGTHVPLIIRFPAKWRHLAPAQPGGVIDELVSLIDLPPTLASLAGLTVPAQFEGRALAGPARRPGPEFTYAFRDRMDERYDLGRVVIGPRYRYIRNYRPDLPAGQHLDYLWRMPSMKQWDELHRAGQLTPTQDAFFQPRAPEELYDVEADPDNTHNLADDPAHRETLLAMRAANRAHLLETRDLGFMPEPMIRRLAAGRSPTALGRDPDLYPLAELLDVIDRLQLEPGSHETVAAGLRDRRALVRTWAAVAALGLPECPAEISTLLADPEPCVAMAAAAVELRHRDNPAAWDILAGALAPTRPPEEILTALNILARFPAYPATVGRALHAIPPATEPAFSNYNRRAAEDLLSRMPADID
jgi:arylsulfatase A-like enzyme